LRIQQPNLEIYIMRFFIFISIALLLSISSVYSQEYLRMIESGNYSVQVIQKEASQFFENKGTGKGSGFKQYKRWEYRALMDMDNDGRLKSPNFYFEEIERYRSEKNTKRTTYYEGSWKEVGPTYWNNENTGGYNPGVGRVTSLAVDASNPNHIIMGSQTGGVWKTTDGGQTWTVLTDNMPIIDVYALAMDPTNTTTYFWGTSGGNLYKSIDGGGTWNPLATVGSGVINKILIDPNNTNKIYCSTTTGIYKSANGGSSWSLIHENATIGYDVEFKPGNTNVIYASGYRFFKSTDGGVSFTSSGFLTNWDQDYISGSADWNIISQSYWDPKITPKSGEKFAYFYAGNYNKDASRLVSKKVNLSSEVNPKLSFYFTNVNWYGDVETLKVLYKTSANDTWKTLANYTAEFSSWNRVTLNLPSATSDYYIAFEATSNWGKGLGLDAIFITSDNSGTILFEDFENESDGAKMLAVSNDNPNLVYRVSEEGGTFSKLEKSTDSGDSFVELVHTNKNYFGYSKTASDTSGQAPRDMDIAVNPNNSDEVILAGINTWRSVDGGQTFTLTSNWYQPHAELDNIGYCHADIDILEFVGNKLYLGSDGGLFVANDTGNLNKDYYQDLTTGTSIHQFYKIGVSQTQSEVLVGGSQDNGSSVLTNNGEWHSWLGADGMEGFVDKDNSNIIYGSMQQGNLRKSTDMGATNQGIKPSSDPVGNWVTPFEQDPNESNTIYAGYNKVFKSINGGDSWTEISNEFEDTSGNVLGNLNHLKVATSNSDYIYIAIGSHMFRTQNGGATSWTRITGFTGNINSIAIHPTDPDKVAIATTDNNKIFITSDGGTTWESKKLNLPDFSALSLVWDDNGNDGLYLGMNFGVFYIDNTISEWQSFSNNLANVRVNELEINRTTGKLYAGTYGRGVWVSDLYGASLSNSEEIFNQLNIYPNPASSAFTISWNSNEPVTVKMFDLRGKLLYYSKNINLSRKYSIDTSTFTPGIYFVRINTIEGYAVKKMVIE